MAAVRKRAGKLETVDVPTPPPSPPPTVPEGLLARRQAAPTLPDLDEEAPLPAHPVARAALVRELEQDRTDNERLRERSRNRRDEQDQFQAAGAVVAYLDGLLRRIRAGTP